MLSQIFRTRRNLIRALHDGRSGRVTAVTERRDLIKRGKAVRREAEVVDVQPRLGGIVDVAGRRQPAAAVGGHGRRQVVGPHTPWETGRRSRRQIAHPHAGRHVGAGHAAACRRRQAAAALPQPPLPVLQGALRRLERPLLVARVGGNPLLQPQAAEHAEPEQRQHEQQHQADDEGVALVRAATKAKTTIETVHVTRPIRLMFWIHCVVWVCPPETESDVVNVSVTRMDRTSAQYPPDCTWVADM
uniref:Uncharacterized protein n=1 Tax=Ralstonia solanacearum TaxID=305 RepID=A0A0S4UJC4_RALSL|nr:conserved protein of unknown function [Ralstonia solanacearum]